MATRTAQVQPVDRVRLAEKPFRAGPVRPNLVRVQQPMALVATRGPEHHTHMLGREGGVPMMLPSTFGASRVILSITRCPISTFA